jgi:hypothetical protein
MVSQDNGIDLVAYDGAGQAVLLGEVKSRVGTSEQWAARFRRNLLAHGTLPRAPFFLIATPERLYFWKQDDSGATDDPPAFTLDATKEFQPYFDKLQKTPLGLGEEALELLVLAWLTDIARRGDLRAKEDHTMRWLSDSGLIAMLERARIEMHPV